MVMSILILLALNVVVTTLTPSLFFLLPFYLISFIRHKKYALPLLVLGTLIEDLIMLHPLGFGLLVTSASLLLVSWLNRVVNAEKIFGALLLFFIMLLVSIATTGWLTQVVDLNYWSYLFTLNALFGGLIVVVASILH